MRRAIEIIAAVALGGAMACGGGAVAPAAPVTAAPPPTPAPVPVAVPPPAPADEPVAELDPYNLGFERAGGELAAGWAPGIGRPRDLPGYEVRATEVAHGGARSLSIRATGGGPVGAFYQSIDARPYRGKRVQLSGWIKTEAVTGGQAQLWLHAVGPIIATDDMNERGVVGTEPWSEVVADVVVPAAARTLTFGGALAGGGEAWFDDLALEIETVTAPAPIVIEGVVRDERGAPVEGAEVALVAVPRRSGSAAIEAHVASGAGGTFRFATTSGRLGVAAHRAGAVGGFVPSRWLTRDTHGVTVVLPDGGGVEVRGRVVAKGGALPAQTHITISPLSRHDTDLFAVAVAADGSFAATVPRGDEYKVYIRSDSLRGDERFARAGDAATGKLEVEVLSPAPPEVAAWIERNAIALTTHLPGSGFADLEAFGRLAGKARIVALGQAAYGTAEVTQLRHRLLEYLVTERGFTTLAINAGVPEVRAINAWVLDGTGNLREAIAGLDGWQWSSLELSLALVWMRSWNEDPAHRVKLQVVGFDVLGVELAYASVAAFLREMAPDEAPPLLAPIELLGRRGSEPAQSSMEEVGDGLIALARTFDGRAAAWRKRAPARFDEVRRDLTLLEQWQRMLAAGNDGARYAEVRHGAMADNLRWHLRRQPRGAGMMVWAHNSYLSTAPADGKSPGSRLRAALGKAYVTVGVVQGEGTFMAHDWTQGRNNPGGLTRHTLDRPVATDVAAPFAVTGKPFLIVDLRTLPRRGVVGDWFRAKHLAREMTSAFAGEQAATALTTLPARFDAVLYIGSTRSAMPLPPRD